MMGIDPADLLSKVRRLGIVAVSVDFDIAPQILAGDRHRRTRVVFLLLWALGVVLLTVWTLAEM
jgi:hypothetical protein